MNFHITKPNIDLNKYKEGVSRVGFFEGSRYDGNTSVAQVARYNEFGVPYKVGSRIPKRPFMRPAVEQNKSMLIETLRSEYKRALKNNDDTMLSLQRFGEYVKGIIQQQIVNTWEPPNAKSTIERKGRNSPLRDTLLMLNSVSHQEEEIR